MKNKDRGHKEPKKIPKEKPIYLGKRRTKLKDGEKRASKYRRKYDRTPNILNYRPPRKVKK